MEGLTSWGGLNGLSVLAVSLVALLAAAAAGSLLCRVLFRVLLRLAARPTSLLRAALIQRWRRPARVLLPLLLSMAVLPLLPLGPGGAAVLRHGLGVAFIGTVAWLLAATVLGFKELVLARYDLQAENNLRARAVHTQVDMLAKILIAVIAVVACAAMLMTFDMARKLGVSLMASAGIAGVILGFAAQRSLATLVAGIQIAFTQPIRLDDVVVVEGEWGRIEEISLTYVVVRIWDQRRLVLPIGYFLEKPFQNWTRVSADLLGAVHLHADYSLPVEELRAELERIVAQEEHWDGRVVNLQVVGATQSTLELRALVSAADSPKAWDLRCSVREKLIDYIRRNHPRSLPRVRASIENVRGEE